MSETTASNLTPPRGCGNPECDGAPLERRDDSCYLCRKCGLFAVLTPYGRWLTVDM